MEERKQGSGKGIQYEKAILVRVILDSQATTEDPLDEIRGLAETAGAGLFLV